MSELAFINVNLVCAR